MSDTELKPCPFCGGEAYINYESMVDERRIYWAQILCKNCHCRSGGNWNNSYANAEKKELTAWNTRRPMERIVEWLESEKKYAEEKGNRNSPERRCRMSDLISREKLLDDMSKVLADILISSINGGCSFDSLKDKVMDCIKKQPVAYDVQVVIDNLITENIHTTFDLDEHWDKCVEIIKAGGVNE